MPDVTPTPRSTLHRVRVEVWLGVYSIAAVVGIVLPAFLVADRQLESTILEQEWRELEREEGLLLGRFTHSVHTTERLLDRLARRASEAADRPATPEDLEAFDRLIARDPDGAWRPRPDAFDPLRDAAIWLPAPVVLDPPRKAFYVRAKRVVEDIAAATDTPISDNVWLFEDGGGIVIHWPNAPRFAYDATAVDVYSDSDWVGLARPENNPTGETRWSDVLFDPISKLWMVSAVRPFSRDGRFAGSVGLDVPIRRMLEPMYEFGRGADATYLVVAPDGRLLASTAHTANLELAHGDLRLDDLDDAALARAIADLAAATDGDGLTTHSSGEVALVGARVPSTGWLVVSAIPADVARERVRAPVALLRSIALASAAIVLVASIVTVSRDRRREREALAARRAAEEKAARTERLEAIGRFAGGIAHDFNNVLTAISGFAQVAMLPRARDAGQQEHLDQIVEACDRASALTRHLLAFAKSQPLEPRTFDLDALVRDTHKLLRRLIGEDIALDVRPAPQPAWVFADPTQMEQLLTNLAANGRDAMPHGGQLTIAVEVRQDDVLLTVRDTGEGMTAEVRRRALEPFFTTKPPGQGTGLGLATCQAIVERAGGTLDIGSSDGAGTTFTIRLPRAAAPPEGRAASPVEAPDLPVGLRVLLIEDDAPVRTAVAGLLRARGCEVIEAVDGAEGLDALAHHPGVACLITDVVMPVLGGGRLVAQVRRDRPDLPIVVISGFVDDPELRTDLATLDVEFLAKPFTGDDVARKVRAATARRRAAASALTRTG